MDITAQSDPVVIFNQWMLDAKAQKAIHEPTAMTLATTSTSGDVNVRVVLCKAWSNQGFTFFTNYLSRKGLDIEKHPKVGVGFYWDPLHRQVKINGTAQKVPRQESEAYWNSRERSSQISQYISKQSQPVSSRQALEEAWAKTDEEFRDKVIPCPSHWGGYLIIPNRIEFWIGQPGRLHDRYSFEKAGSIWTFHRLSP